MKIFREHTLLFNINSKNRVLLMQERRMHLVYVAAAQLKQHRCKKLVAHIDRKLLPL